MGAMIFFYVFVMFCLEPSQKHFKRRRSLINWAFWRGPGHQLNDPASNAGPRGDLFGQPLSSLCLEDALPKPITVGVGAKGRH
jgi:hypothetical protein